MTTTSDELRNLIKGGYFFNFCVGFALNKGYRAAIKEKKEVAFSVGDYDVKFNAGPMNFTLTHKIYFARVIVADYFGVTYVGGNEEEVIAELLSEFEKELNKNLYEQPNQQQHQSY